MGVPLESTLTPAFVAASIHLLSFKAVLEECWSDVGACQVIRSCMRRSLLRIHRLKMPSRRGLVLANTWKGAAPTCHTPRSPDDHRVDFVAFSEAPLL